MSCLHAVYCLVSMYESYNIQFTVDDSEYWELLYREKTVRANIDLFCEYLPIGVEKVLYVQCFAWSMHALGPA